MVLPGGRGFPWKDGTEEILMFPPSLRPTMTWKRPSVWDDWLGPQYGSAVSEKWIIEMVDGRPCWMVEYSLKIPPTLWDWDEAREEIRSTDATHGDMFWPMNNGPRWELGPDPIVIHFPSRGESWGPWTEDTTQSMKLLLRQVIFVQFFSSCHEHGEKLQSHVS